jgi:hypothetical protein
VEAPTVVSAEPVSPAGESRAKAWGFTGLLMFLYVVNWADKAVLGLVAQQEPDQARHAHG